MTLQPGTIKGRIAGAWSIRRRVRATNGVWPAQYLFTRQTSPARTEVAYASAPGVNIATLTDGARTITLKGPSRTFQQPDLPLIDLFDRTRTDDWGTSHAPNPAYAATSWSESGGTTGAAGDYSITGSAGRIKLTSVNVSRRSTLNDMNASDTDVTTKIRIDVLPVGNSISIGVILRYQNTTNFYLARVRVSTTGAIFAVPQVDLASVFSDLATEVNTGLTYVANTWLNIRAEMTGTVLRMKVWADGASEPVGWTVTGASNSSFTSGRAGVRAILMTGNTNVLPVYVEVDEFQTSGVQVTPATVAHDTWVRLLPTAFTEPVDEVWLTNALADTSPDALAIAAQYLHYAPAILDGALQIAGPTDYGPMNTDGSRIEGSDFNDYLGLPWTYGGTTDNPEVEQFRCLDCSGFIRMIFGYRLGYPMTHGSTVTAGKIPRDSNLQSTDSPGVLLVPNTGVKPALTGFSIGDILFFDADSIDTNIDHVGMYMGLDPFGSYRFISSRKSPNGPTFSDAGGSSKLDGTGTYANAFRSARRL